jgi:hypothetical protein
MYIYKYDSGTTSWGSYVGFGTDTLTNNWSITSYTKFHYSNIFGVGWMIHDILPYGIATKTTFSGFSMTTTDLSAMGLPNQRKSFNATGLTWLFYSDGTNMVYTTSPDNINWADATVVRAATSSEQFSVWYDGTYFYYAYGVAEDVNPLPSYLSFRSGTPNVDSSITWNGAEEQINVDPVDIGHNGYGAENPYICVDTLGYVWISYTDNGWACVIKSGNTDGTWGSTYPSSFFPYTVSAQSFPWKTTVVPLTAGKVLVTYADDGKVNARYFGALQTTPGTGPPIDNIENIFIGTEIDLQN